MLYVTLDIARGLASLWVVLFHLEGLIPDNYTTLINIASAGSLGVPVFFVISGYCMMASTQRILKNNGSAKKFLWKRFLRIYPPYWCSIVVILLTPFILEMLSFIKTGVYLVPNQPMLHMTPSEWFQYISLSRVFFNANGDLSAAFSPINIVYWTLAIEFQFYIIMYLALVFHKYFSRILIVVTVLSMVSFLSPLIRNSGLFINYWPAFACGILLFVFLRNGNPVRKQYGTLSFTTSVLLGVSCLMALVFLISNKLIVPLVSTPWDVRVFIFGVLFMLIFWLIAPLDQFLSSLRTSTQIIARTTINAFVLLGTISYSLYLIHTKLYQFPLMLARQVFNEGTISFFILIIMGTIFTAYVFYYFFERPFISSRVKTIEVKEK